MQVFSKDGDRLQGYVGLSIRGRCGPIDDSLSERVPKQYPGGVFPVLKGMYFDPATWDGSDVFTVKGRASFICVLDSVRAALTS